MANMPTASTTELPKLRRSPCAAIALAAALLALALPLAAAASPAETVLLFDPSVPETPESIVFDRSDNAYITLAMTGEIVKVAPDGMRSPLVSLPIGAPCPLPRVTNALGLAIDAQDRLYVAVNTCDPADQGIYRVSIEQATAELIAPMPAGVVSNGIDVDHGTIYIADTFDGRVWRVDAAGGTPEVWSDDPLLKRPPGAIFPGPNGLRVFRRAVYVANSVTGTIVAIPIEPDRSAGTGFVHATLPFPQGCDEFAFDVRGSIYCTTDPFNTILRLDPDGTVETLLTAADLLDGPTSVAFGRRGQNRKNLYITNAAFPIFTTTFRPSLMRLRLDLPGAP